MSSKQIKTTRRTILAAVLALLLILSVTAVIAISADTPTGWNAEVVLDGKINLHIKHTEAIKGAAKYTATITGGEGYSRTVSNLESKVEKNSDGGIIYSHVVAVPLYPYEMTCDVRLDVLSSNDEVLETKATSVKAYANLLRSNPDHADEHNAVVAMLNYGAAAQKLNSGINTGAYANEGLFTKNNPISYIDKVSAGTFAEPEKAEGITGSVSLVFGSNNIALRYRISGYNGNEKLKVSFDDKNGVNQSGYLEKQSDGSYQFTIRNLGVNTMAHIWNVTISEETSGNKILYNECNVLKYLDWNIKSETTSAEQKDVCRALYQLYNHTANKDALAGCTHQNSGFSLSAGEGISTRNCMSCFAQLSDAMSNGITYISAQSLGAAATVDDKNIATSSYVEADDIARITWTGTKSTEWIWLREAYELTPEVNNGISGGIGGDDGKFTNKSFDIGSARYVVVRLKTTIDGNISFQLGSTAWTKGNVETPDNQASIYSAQTLVNSKTQDWTTYVIDLAAFDKKVLGEGNTTLTGDLAIDSMKFASVNGDAEDTLDLDFIAFVNDWNEIDALTEDTTVQYRDKTGVKTYNTQGEHTHVNKNCDTLCDECGEESGITPPIGHTNNDCDKLCDVCGADGQTPTHTNINNDAKCDVCGEETDEVPGAYVLDPNWLLKNDHNSGDADISVTDGAYVFTPTGTKDNDSAMATFTRNPADRGGTAVNNYINVGAAKYIVIKYKIEAINRGEGKDPTIDSYRIAISTKAKDSADTSEAFEGCSAIVLYHNQVMLDGWTYYVIDAENVLLDHNGNKGIYAAEENGNYIIDTLTIDSVGYALNSGTMKLGFIAFAENAEEIENLLPDADGTVLAITSSKLNSAKASNGVTANKQEQVVGGQIQHTVNDCRGICTVCGVTGAETNIAHTANCGGVCTVCGIENLPTEIAHTVNCGGVCTVCGATGQQTDLAHTANCQGTCTVCGATGQTPSMHADKDFNSSCDVCAEGLITYGGEILTPAELKEWVASSTGSSAKVDEDGNFHVTATSANCSATFAVAAADKGGSDIGATKNVGNGKYMVIKYRTGDGMGMRIHISTSNVSSADTTNDKDGYGGIALAAAGDNVWTYYIVDLTKVQGYDGKQTCVADANGDYILDTFLIEQTAISGNKSLDIAYIAFMETSDQIDALFTYDNDVESVKIVKTTKLNATGTPSNAAANASTVPVSESVVNGKIQHTAVNCKCSNCNMTPINDNHVNAGCDTLCDICGIDGQDQGSPHTNIDGDDKCDACGATVEDPGAYVLTGQDLLNWSNSGSSEKLNGENYQISVTEGTANISAKFVSATGDLNSSYGKEKNIHQARYIIFKIKGSYSADYLNTTPNPNPQLRCLISTKAVNSNNPSDATTRNTYASFRIFPTIDNTWRYEIIDTAELYGFKDNRKVFGLTDGDYIIDTFYFEQSSGSFSTIELEYIAFADDLGEIEKLLTKDAASATQVMWTTYSRASKHPTNADTPAYNPEGQVRASETVTGGKLQHTLTSTNTGNVYTVTCTKCKQVLATKDFNVESVKYNALLVPDNWLATKYQAGNNNKKQVAEDGNWFARFELTTDYCWLRETYSYTIVDGVEDKTQPNSGLGGGGSINVGNSEYIVIRVKSNTAGKVITGRVSTTGYNLEDTNGAAAGQANISSMVTYGTCTEADTWYTFYVKMTDKTSGAGGKVWVKDDTTQTYVVDTLTLNSSGITDIAYIAFVDTLAEAQALVAADAAQ